MSKLTERSTVDQRFALDLENLRRQGCDLDLSLALYPMLAGSNTRHAREAQQFLWRNRTGPIDADDTEGQRQQHMALQEARQMTLRAGYEPTPDHIRAEHTPGEAALNKRLDAATAGKPFDGSNLKPLGDTDVRPDNPLAAERQRGADLSVTKDWQPTKTYRQRNNGGYYRIDREIDL